MKDPTLHITRSSLIEILDIIGYSNPKAVADSIFRLCDGYQIRDRFVTNVTTKKTSEALDRAKRLNNAPMAVDQFQLLLIDVRQKLGHRMISRITLADRDYLLLKDICVMACDFAKATKAKDLSTGCRLFLQIGIELMRGKYALNKFKTYRDRIYNTYEFYALLQEDETPDLTEEVRDAYLEGIMEVTGIDTSRDYKSVEERINFLYAKRDIVRNKATIDDWITAQIATMYSDFDTLPNPNQLYGDNACKRYKRFKMVKRMNGEVEEEKPRGSIMSEYNKKVRK